MKYGCWIDEIRSSGTTSYFYEMLARCGSAALEEVNYIRCFLLTKEKCNISITVGEFESYRGEISPRPVRIAEFPLIAKRDYGIWQDNEEKVELKWGTTK